MGFILNHTIKPIGYIETPFQQKFAIPRQGNNLSIARGTIHFEPHVNAEQALQGIEEFSHVWVLFLFHQNLAQGYKDMVRPPRLGGNKKVGVFASRSSFRPNGIGMSVMQNLGIDNKTLKVGGVDLLNNTPIIDIKPYLPYADIQENAHAGFAEDKPPAILTITYSQNAQSTLSKMQGQYSDLITLLESILSQDPRPAYKKQSDDDKIYHVSLYDLDIAWQIVDKGILVINANRVSN
jgi:tRNA-Thr(GGU) m(6)t(6)A37 methyltransferase TsaA